jgi:hypothetical protein
VKRLFLLALLASCTVADTPYPIAWDPIPAPAAADCRQFEGTYADRGEAFGQTARPSLTRELFGADSPWEKAASVRIELAAEDSVEVTVSGEGLKPETRRFSLKAGEARCDRGRLELVSKRWVASDIMSGRESVKIELNQSDPFLVTHVYESITGVMFLVVPLSGESARWFRFPRLKP